MSQPNVKQDMLKPDHGENFVPGSEAAPENLAPQPLDHFKRGYRERADLRDREMSQLSNDFDFGREPAYTEPPPTNNFQNKEPRGSFRGGFDPARLVDALCRPGCNLNDVLDRAKEEYFTSFSSGKALTAILSNLARRRKIGIALSVWHWMDQRAIQKNVFHYNSLISVCEKMKDNQRALGLLREMEEKGIAKNEVTFSSAISACEKAGQWRVALELLDRMKKEGVGRTAIAYNAAISACEKGLVPHKALELFEQMKREGVTPTVITYSALISAAEKGQQWKLALEVLEEMKASGHGANVIAYSAAISALSKGQMWEKALELFREIEKSGNTPSIVTYNATMTALEKGLQWERALDLFDEMKLKRLQITVVSYGSAISACEKGLQYRQCLEYLDEMTELGIKKNVIIFGAAMSCMEKCCRADIAFQLMDRMKMEGVAPNVHIYNSAISACARCDLWEKGLELFTEMEKVGVVKDVVSYNAVLDAVCSQVALGRKLFQEGVERGFYARVSRLGTQWLELDLHFLSLGGGEIALGWWFEECLVPYLVNTSKLAAVKSIDIVTGYGKTRMRGVRHGDDGMRKRVRAMLSFMGIKEVDQPNKGRIHIDKEALMEEVKEHGGKIVFDQDGYRRYKQENTTANHIPNVDQKVRPRYSAAHFRDVPLGGDSRDVGSRDKRGRKGQNGHNSGSHDFKGRRRSSDSSNYHHGSDRRHQEDRYKGPEDRYRSDHRRGSYDHHDGTERYSSGNYNQRHRGIERDKSRYPGSDYYGSRGGESSRHSGALHYSQGDGRDHYDNPSRDRSSHYSRNDSHWSHSGSRETSRSGSYADRDRRGPERYRDSAYDDYYRRASSSSHYNSGKYSRKDSYYESRHRYDDSNAPRSQGSGQARSDTYSPAPTSAHHNGNSPANYQRGDIVEKVEDAAPSHDRYREYTGPQDEHRRRSWTRQSNSNGTNPQLTGSDGTKERHSSHGDSNKADDNKPPPRWSRQSANIKPGDGGTENYFPGSADKNQQELGSGESRRGRSSSRDRDPEKRRHRKNEDTDHPANGERKRLRVENDSSNEGSPGKSGEADRPYAKRRGYEIQQSRSSFNAKRGFSEHR